MEEERKTLIGRAISIRDVEALLRVSYPTLAGLSADPQLECYLMYIASLIELFRWNRQIVRNQWLDMRSKRSIATADSSIDSPGALRAMELLEFG